MKDNNFSAKCRLCSKEVAANQMLRHVKAHLKKASTADLTKPAYLLKIEAKYAPHYLYILVSGDMALYELDDFLKAIWLDCCGHMSGFNLPGRRTNNKLDEDDFGGLSMNLTAGEIFSLEKKLDYQYDYGSTTHLSISSKEQYKVKFPNRGRGILLLARNEAPVFDCGTCGNEAEVKTGGFCLECNYDGKSPFVCASCIPEHKCEEYGDTPFTITNSPRMGVCAYDGNMDNDSFKVIALPGLEQ